jgi:HTH-type transcriptional regulator/antitoxin HigA
MNPTDGNEFKPDWAIPPGHTLVEELEERGIGVDEFAACAGIDPEHLRRLATGQDALDTVIARVLEERLGIPARFWLRSEQLFREHLWTLWHDKEGR